MAERAGLASEIDTPRLGYISLTHGNLFSLVHAVLLGYAFATLGVPQFLARFTQVCRLHRVLHDELTDLKSHIRAHTARKAVMEAGPDASVRYLICEGAKVAPTVDDSGCSRTGHRNLGYVGRAEHRLDDRDCGTTFNAMRARIFRVHRRVVHRLPSGVTISRRVVIDVPICGWQ